MKLFGFLGLAALAGGGVWAVWGGGEAPDVLARDGLRDALFTVRRGALEIVVSEGGYLKARNSELLKPAFRGQGTITWLVDEGLEVQEGDALVEFDTTDLEQQLLEAENALIQHETELEAARAELAVQERENLTTVEKAELALEVSRLALARYAEGEMPNELRKRELAVEKTLSEHERALERFEQVPELEAEGFLTKIQVEEERIALREAEINRENAVRELELYREYTVPMEQKQKQADVRDAERDLVSAREKAGINLRERQARTTQRERQVAAARSNLKRLQDELEKHRIVAPGPGVVHYGDAARPWERDRIKVGNNVSQGNTIITLPDLSEMEVLVNVHEADVDQVREGQEVRITLDTHRGTVFSGRVVRVASVATSGGWGDDNNKRFRVDILMDPSEAAIRAGVSATADILVERREDVLYVPVQSVFVEGDESFCFAVEGGGWRKRAVVIGSSNAHHVEVASGLEAGESVLLYDPRKEGLVEEPPAPEDAAQGLGGLTAPAEG